MKWFIKDNKFFENFKSDKSIGLAAKLSFLMLILCFGVFLLTFRRLPPQVPLFYSLPWGEQQLTPTISLLLLPLGVFFITILNFLLIMTGLKNHFLAAKILTWITACLVFLTGVTLCKIIFLIY